MDLNQIALELLLPWLFPFRCQVPLVLTNSCMSSLPMYVMGFYSLPKGLHSKMDTIRYRFFCRGANDVFKYHMSKWVSVCKHKIHGGLGLES
jgi:hypothetical protein